MDWEPIKRTSVEVLGTDPDAHGPLRVRVLLDPRPDRQWLDAFEQARNTPVPMSLHPPRVTWDSIELRVPDAELDKYVEHVDARVAGANEEYRERILPALQERQRREEAEVAATEARLAAARAKAAEL